MSTMEQSTKSNGNPAEVMTENNNEEYYRFMLVPEIDFTAEVLIPDDESTSITPIVAHTDDLFKRAVFTYDTDSFIHRVGVKCDKDTKRMVETDINNYVLYYRDAFVDSVRDYINAKDALFTVEQVNLREIVNIPMSIGVECYQCVFNTEYEVSVKLPIYTIILNYCDVSVVIRSIPGVDSIVWHMYPTLFPPKSFENDDRVSNAIFTWTDECVKLCDKFEEDIKKLFDMMSLQKGVTRMYPAKKYQIESPMFTVLADHTASHYAQLSFGGGYVVYIIADKPYCYSTDAEPKSCYVRNISAPLVGVYAGTQIHFGNDTHVRVYLYTGGLCEATVELTGVSVFRVKLYESFFRN